MTQLVHSLATEATLGEEVASNEPVFSKCERKPQSQLVKVPASQCVTVIISANIYFPQDMVQYNIGSLSRITFHYPPTFTERDVVIIISRCDFLHFLCVVLTLKMCQGLWGRRRIGIATNSNRTRLLLMWSRVKQMIEENQRWTSPSAMARFRKIQVYQEEFITRRHVTQAVIQIYYTIHQQ